ncbi:hypothetical protein SH449x_003971 [Pirellulaceae bacterium SH449]
MMQKILQAFLWLCTALLLGQFAILTMASAKGHFNKDTVTYIVALLSGIDIKSQRIGAAIRDAKAAPVPTEEQVLEANSKLSLDTDNKMASLIRLERDLQERARMLDKEKERLDGLVAEYKRAVKENEETTESESLRKVSEIIQALDPSEAKVQLTKMLERDKKDDVISILTGMDAEKQKKILAEFTDDKDREDLAKILEEIRARGSTLPVPAPASGP